MVQKQIEETHYRTAYVAYDGTEFECKEDCLRYEKSAVGVLRMRIQPIVIRDTIEDILFNCGSCENTVLVLLPTKKEHLDDIRHLMACYGCSESYVRQLTDDYLGQVLTLTIGYAGEGAWFDSLECICNRAVGPDYEVSLKLKKNTKKEESTN